MDNTIRIQKLLSDQGVLSRRRTEELIREGRITVNGRPARLGHPVDPGRDIVAIDGERVWFKKKKKNYYVMLHKPRGYLTTMQDDRGRRTVADLIAGFPAHLYPVGRLDKDSEGLLLMTNDGNFANTLMHPGNHIGKTYRVTVRPEVTEEQLVRLAAGVTLDDGYTTQPAQVHVLAQQPGRAVLQMTITEGKNRQIRRMCEAVGLEVARLKRTYIGPLKLGMLQPGEYGSSPPASSPPSGPICRRRTTAARGRRPPGRPPKSPAGPPGKRPRRRRGESPSPASPSGEGEPVLTITVTGVPAACTPWRRAGGSSWGRRRLSWRGRR